jgi:hypothetical protein
MNDLFDNGVAVPDTIPRADRNRSYDGDYMKTGRIAEEKIMVWLTAQPWVLGVDDLRSFRALREADVDVSVRLTDGRATLAEIKSDRWLGVKGNMLFEVLRINHTCDPVHAVTLGWSARSPAQWLLYYAPSKGLLYRVKMDDFRLACQTYTNEMRKNTLLNYVPTDNLKSTITILIPEKYVAATGSFKIFDLDAAVSA